MQGFSHLKVRLSLASHSNLDQFGGEVVINIVKTHPQVLVRGILIENPYYVGPDEFLRSVPV